jgi:hypothetical protein
VRAEARRELLHERNSTISQLISAIEEKADRSSNHAFVRDAMTVLGDIRASEAIDVLVRHIAYPRTATIEDRQFTSAGRISIGDAGLPAIDALVKIGEPCVDAVIMKIRTTTVANERIACVGVLRRLKVPFMRERLGAAVAVSNEREGESVREALMLFDEWVSPEERVKRLHSRIKEYPENNPLRQ